LYPDKWKLQVDQRENRRLDLLLTRRGRSTILFLKIKISYYEEVT